MPKNDSVPKKHRVEIVKTWIVWEHPGHGASLGPYSDLSSGKSFIPCDPNDVRDATLVIEGADGAQYLIGAMYAVPCDEVPTQDETADELQETPE